MLGLQALRRMLQSGREEVEPSSDWASASARAKCALMVQGELNISKKLPPVPFAKLSGWGPT